MGNGSLTCSGCREGRGGEDVEGGERENGEKEREATREKCESQPGYTIQYNHTHSCDYYAPIQWPR